MPKFEDASFTDPVPQPTITYGYDNAGQLTSAGDGTGGVPDRSWTYGTRGNRLTSVEDGVTTTYTTNPNGSVAKTTRGTHTVTYAYDDAGRKYYEFLKDGTTDEGATGNGLTTEGYPTSIQVIRPGQPTTSETRTYNADGLQVTSNTGISGGAPAVPRTYQWDTTQAIPQIVEARNSGSMWFRTTWGNQRTAYKEGTAAPQWFQYDVRGSVIRTDPTNTDVVIGPVQYDPFGGYTNPTGSDRIGYRGELTASNLVYLRARNYDPATGQFTSQDELDGVNGTSVVANKHHYTDNDPLNSIDPLGLATSDCQILGCRYVVNDVAPHLASSLGDDSSPWPNICFDTGSYFSEVTDAANSTGVDPRALLAVLLTETANCQGSYHVPRNPDTDLVGYTKGPFNMGEKAFLAVFKEHPELIQYCQLCGLSKHQGNSMDTVAQVGYNTLSGDGTFAAMAAAYGLQMLDATIQGLLDGTSAAFGNEIKNYPVRSLSVSDLDRTYSSQPDSDFFFRSALLGVGWARFSEAETYLVKVLKRPRGRISAGGSSNSFDDSRCYGNVYSRNFDRGGDLIDVNGTFGPCR